MFKAKPVGSLQSYEQKAFALYFAHEIHYPYVSITLVSLVAAWLMYGHVPTAHILLWFFGGALVSLLRELFVSRMKPKLAEGHGHTTLLHGFAIASLLIGLVWGAFAWLYFDPQRPLSVLLVGSYLAGHVGGAVTPLSIYLPAFYLFLLPTLLPYVLLLLRAGTQDHLVLAGLSLLFLFSMARYAHMTNRLHRESMRLRHENQNLIEDLGLRRVEAENASRTKSLFLAGISHDLKQPLRAIAMYTGFLRHSAAGVGGEPAVVAQTAAKIETAVAAIQGQVARLLELSRLESGTLALKLEAVSLHEVFAHVERLLGAQAQARGVRLHFATTRRQVQADRGMLDSILQNLVSNAIQHTEAGQRVYVGTRWRQQYPPEQRLCIEVRDAGNGVAAERLPLLFDAYRSFDDRRGSESHGLGLAIAQAQAAYLGGEIVVVSQPGCGSTFTLCGLRALDSAEAEPCTPD